MKPTNPSLPRRIAGVCAIALAVSVVAYLIWRAQSTSQTGRSVGDVLPIDGSAVANVMQSGESATPVYLPSSKQASPGTLRYLIGAPRRYHWHHAIATKGQFNFANLSPLMDLLFGTYHDPKHMPAEVGIVEPFARNYVAALAEPLLPRKLLSRWASWHWR